MKTIKMLLIAMAVLLVATPAYPLDLGYVFSGTIGSTAPYAQVTLTSVSGGVQFDLKNLTAGNLGNPAGSSKLFDFYFNYKGSSNLTFINPTDWTITYSPDNNPADGGGYYDFVIAGNTNTFLATGSTLTFKISGDAVVSNFIDLAAPHGGNGVYNFATHIGSLANPAGDSAWVGDNNGTGITVPEPGTILLLGFALVGLAGVRRFKK